MIFNKLNADLIYIGKNKDTQKAVEKHFPFNKFLVPNWLFCAEKFPDIDFLKKLFDEVIILDINSTDLPKFTKSQIEKLVRLKVILISETLPEKLPSIPGIISWVNAPFSKESWSQAMSQINFFVPSKMENEQLDPENKSSLLVILQSLTDEFENKISISASQGMKIVKLDEVLYCFSEQSYSIIISEKREPIISSKPLKFYENILGGPNFFRAHNRYLINLQHVDSYRSAEGVVKMEDGHEIHLSTRKKKEFIKYLKQT